MKNKSPGHRFSATGAVTALVMLALLQARASADEFIVPQGEPRESHTMRFDSDGGRARSSAASISEDRYGPLVADGDRLGPAKAQRHAKPGATYTAARGVSNDFWFFHADVVLFNDDDHDGYFHGIDVLFDVDTYYEFADVYAALYLSYEGGPWNEYAITDTFRIFGATSDDEYVVVTELMSGYPRGHYDLLIELYDAWDGTFLVDLGPADHPDLAFLPLEDFNRDAPRKHRRGGGGAIDPWTALMLAMCALAAWLVRRRSTRRGCRYRPGAGHTAAARAAVSWTESAYSRSGPSGFDPLRGRISTLSGGNRSRGAAAPHDFPTPRGTHDLAPPGGQRIESGVEGRYDEQ